MLRMGLDSYVYRTKKVKGFTVEDYLAVDRAIGGPTFRYGIDKEPETISADLEKTTGIKNANQLKSEAILRKGHRRHSIFDMYAYSKNYPLHDLFVKYVQDGKDDLGYYLVSKEQLEEMLKEVADRSNKQELKWIIKDFFLSVVDFEKEVLIYNGSW